MNPLKGRVDVPPEDLVQRGRDLSSLQQSSSCSLTPRTGRHQSIIPPTRFYVTDSGCIKKSVANGPRSYISRALRADGARGGSGKSLGRGNIELLAKKRCTGHVHTRARTAVTGRTPGWVRGRNFLDEAREVEGTAHGAEGRERGSFRWERVRREASEHNTTNVFMGSRARTPPRPFPSRTRRRLADGKWEALFRKHRFLDGGEASGHG